jgi:RNA polymerase sigma-70 factor (ECF subfamily)
MPADVSELPDQHNWSRPCRTEYTGFSSPPRGTHERSNLFHRACAVSILRRSRSPVADHASSLTHFLVRRWETPTRLNSWPAESAHATPHRADAALLRDACGSPAHLSSCLLTGTYVNDSHVFVDEVGFAQQCGWTMMSRRTRWGRPLRMDELLESLPHRDVPLVADADVTAAIGRAQLGDERAFRVLYQAVQPRLYRYLVVLVGQDAEDVASEAWLQIARDLRSFRGDADRFRGWAATIARHRALDQLRHGRRRPVAAMPTDRLPELPARQDTADAAIELISTDAALALIASLPPEQAEAVVLAVVFGMNAKSAGAVLGKRPGAVRTAVYRGLRTLAKRAEGQV